MANTDAEYRKKRLEQNRDLDTLITEETEGGDILKKQVYDVMEYIEKEANIERNPVARKILKLKEFGITDEQIVQKYKENAGSMENENTALSNLEVVFRELVNYINEIPNGVVIDLATAEKNDLESFNQAIQYGIYPESAIVEAVSDKMAKSIENWGKTPDNEEINFLLENFMQEYIGNSVLNNELGADVEEFLKKNENELNLTDDLKKVYRNNKNIFENSVYRMDPHLFEISKLQVMLNGAKGKQNYNLILAKIQDFYEKHPEYDAKKLPVLNPDGTLNQDEIVKMQEHSESYQKLIILEHVDKLNGMSPQELEYISTNERKHMTMCAFAGLKYRNAENEENRKLAEESMKMIKQLYPNLDLNNDKQLAEFFYENSGMGAKYESLSLQKLIEIYSYNLKETAEGNIGKRDFREADLDLSERKFFKSAMKNYFVGSNIRFTEKDEQDYNKLYRDVTIESWIENKENAIKLRYAALTTIRDEYKNNPVGTYTEKKLAEIEKDIEAFEKRFGKVDLTPKEGDVPFDVYRDDFVKAGLTKYLTRDARDWSEGADYAKLDDEHKKGYIRNILVALEDNTENNSYMTKIALRRLELMGDGFVEIKPNGEYKINEELILEEYKKLSDYNYPSYEQLAESAKLRKNEYLLKKLEEYTNLPESAFVGLDNRNNSERSIEQIDNARYASNQKRIDQIVNGVERPRKTEKIPDADMVASIKGGKIEVEEINVSHSKTVSEPQVSRDESKKNQEEQDGLNGESGTASEMKVDTIDTTGIEENYIQENNVKPTFIENVRNTLARIRKSISEFLGIEEKPKMLNEGKKENKKELTEEEKKAQYNETFRPVEPAPVSRVTEVEASTSSPERDEER